MPHILKLITFQITREIFDNSNVKITPTDTHKIPRNKKAEKQPDLKGHFSV
ncbi:MAG TPA: hypothetical protein VK021_05885 [Flavobacteriaceae bacterium]|nr:hypothetical protein [Flavobacteriaceae bacterium]